MNSAKGLYESCSSAHPRALKADRYASIDLNKENYHQPEQLGRKFSNNVQVQGLSERTLNYSSYSSVPKRKDSQVYEIRDTIEKIEGYQQICIKELKLKEAQETKEKVIELKQELAQKQKQQVEEKYQCDMKILTESQAAEMSDFNEFWDLKVAEFEAEASQVEEEMLQRHQQEVFRVKDELKKMIPMKKKVSTQHLNYKKSLEALLKQKEFIEAERIRVLCEELEREERNKAYNEKEQRVKFFMGQLDQRHRNELNVLRKRISTGREELLKAKVIELEKLLQKFQNARHQLEKDKHLGLSKLEITQKNILGGGDESSYRSCSKASNRTYRSSKNTLRMRDSSKIGSLNVSMMSPTSNPGEAQQFVHLSPTIKSAKHKRSCTNTGKDFDLIGLCNMIDQQSEVKTKRSNSVIKQH